MGATDFSPSMREFTDFIFSMGLLDLPVDGGNFTWSNARSRSRSPFRFENMWLKSEGFHNRVHQWWYSYLYNGSPSYVLN